MFDLQRFEKKLRSQLTGTTVGYEYAIYQGTAYRTSGADGFAVISSQTRMTPDRRMTVASMSKTVTAAAFMRALEILKAAGKNLTIDSKMAPYLPSAWLRGRLVNDLTFKHLLTHFSGLHGVEDEDLFDSLKQTIRNGAILTDLGPEYDYQNCNYSLFRILIPNMLYGVAVSDEPDNSAIEAQIKELQAELQVASPTEKAKLIAQIEALQAQIEEGDPAERTARLYFEFVRQEVLGRVGLSTVSLAPKDAQEVLEYYNFHDTSKTYKDPSFTWHLLRVGAGHWYMSAKEFARFIAGLCNGQIVSGASFQQMTDNSLGMGASTDTTRGGTNWEHGGGFDRDNGAGMEGTWMILPNGWATVVLVNSNGGLRKSPGGVIRNAFNAAWLSPPITNAAPAATSLARRIYALIKADDNRIYVNRASAGEPFRGWMEVEGNGTTDVSPASASLGNRIYVFAKGVGDGRLYVNSAPSGHPFDGRGKGWVALPDMTTDAAPAAASLGDRIYVFVKGLDTHIYYSSALDGQSFDGWKPVDGDGTTNVAPAAASLRDRVYVFAKGIGDGRIYVNSALKGLRFDGWGNGWSALPGKTTDAAPAAASLGDRIYVFIKGLDTRIYVNSALHGQAFGGWKEVEGNGTSDSAQGAAWLNDRIYVFAKGIGDNRIYVNSALSGLPFDGWDSGWSEVQW